MADQKFEILDGLNVTDVATFSSNVAVDTNVLKVDTVTNRVGINVTSPTEALDVGGDILASGNVYASAFVGDGSFLTGVASDNANTLDGIDSTGFLRSNVNDNLDATLTVTSGGTGKILVNTGSQIKFGDGAYIALGGANPSGDANLQFDGVDVVFNCGTADLVITSPVATFSANVAASFGVFSANVSASYGIFSANVTATGFEGSGLEITNLNASNIGSGTLSSDRLPDLAVSDFGAAAIQLGTESFVDSDTVLMTAAAVQDKIESYGYSNAAPYGDSDVQDYLSAGTATAVFTDLDVTHSVDGAHNLLINNANTGASAQAILEIRSNNEYVDFVVDHTGNYLREVGSSIVTRYTDYNSHNWRTTGGSSLMTLDSSGNLVATGDINTTSDARLKTDVETISDALNIVKSLRGVRYTKDDKRSIGVIAQEIREHLPEVVNEGSDTYLSVAYGNIIGLLIEAIKELEKKIDNK